MSDNKEANLNETQPQTDLTSQVKHDWYQTESAVAITVLMKNVRPEDLSVEFEDRTVTLRVGDLQLKYELAYKIVPTECGYKTTPSKIELKLAKRDRVPWSRLEAEKTEKAEGFEGAAAAGPLKYPTSAPGRDWAAIEREIAEQEKREKPEGEEALNRLFKDIYSRGGDDVKMAMNKSWLESGGTVLSTNWDEIKKEKVPIKPPDGMEWKEWK